MDQVLIQAIKEDLDKLLGSNGIASAAGDINLNLTENTLEREILLKGLEISTSDYQNRDLINWRRIRSAIEHENILVNHRVTWLLLSQAALIAAFATLYSKWWELKLNGATENSVPTNSVPTADFMILPLVLLGMLGVLLCANLFMSLRDATQQIGRLTEWWYMDAFKKLASDPNAAKNAYIDRNTDHPEIHLWKSTEIAFEGRGAIKHLRTLFQTETIPVYFAVAWFFMILGVLIPNNNLKLWSEVIDAVQPYVAPVGLILVALILIGIGVILAPHLPHKQVPRSRR